MTERPRANDKSSPVSTSPPNGERSTNQHDKRPPVPIVKTIDLTQRYGSTLALDHVSLSVAPGGTRRIPQPERAGKSTCIKLLTTITDHWDAPVVGFDVREHRDPE